MGGSSAAAEAICVSPGDHPSVRAWREIAGSRSTPDRVEVLDEKKWECRVSRLVGAGPEGGSVIGKWCRTEVAARERFVYQEVLSQLPVSTLECYGVASDEQADFCWLFLEDAGDERYCSHVEEHRALAGGWLGRMNIAAEGLAAAKLLPQRDADFYLDMLRLGRGLTEEKMADPAIAAKDAKTLKGIVSRCNALEKDWSVVDGLCQGIPCTLVHGDLASKNARVRNDPGGKSLLVIDWESAGWGIPAADLASFGQALTPDVEAYWEVVRVGWPGQELAYLRRIAKLGNILRFINAVVWTNYGFEYSAEWFIRQMRCYLRNGHLKIAELESPE